MKFVSLESLTQERDDVTKDPHDEKEQMLDIVVRTIERRLWLLYYSLDGELAYRTKADTEGSSVVGATQKLIEDLRQFAMGLATDNLGTGYYKMCNRSLRVFPAEFAMQLIRLRYGPEESYFKKVKDEISRSTGKDRRLWKSKLNTFYYKLILSKYHCDPTYQRGLLNVFVSGEMPINFEFLILDYFVRQEQIQHLKLADNNKKNRSVQVSREQLDKYRQYGEAYPGYISQAIDQLMRDDITWGGLSGFIENHRSFQVFDEHDRISNKEFYYSYYGILPAAQYFIENLSVSCEYVFWSVMNVELTDEEINLITNAQDNPEWRNDYIAFRDHPIVKIKLLRLFIHRILLPKYRRFVEQYNDVHGENIKDSINEYCYNKLPYPLRLISSLINWLDFADIKDEERKSEREQLIRIEREYVELFTYDVKKFIKEFFDADKQAQWVRVFGEII